MAWALIYNAADIAVIGSAANTIQTGGGGVSTADRNAMRGMWTAGMSAWATAPVAPPSLQEGDPQMRVLTCSAGSLQSFVDLSEKYTRSNRLTNHYLLALCRDMRRPSGGKASWP
jgi:hypothetical protein